VGPAVACVRAHDVEVHASGERQAPLLTVVGRREAAHEVLLDLRDPSDPSDRVVTLRVPGGSDAHVGDHVQIAWRTARLYPSA
jgi:hypothetical protein